MFLKGKYKNIIFITVIFFGLIYFNNLFQTIKFRFFVSKVNPAILIGQRLMISPMGIHLSKEFTNLIKTYHIGNLKIYGEDYKNKKQLNQLIVNAQNLSLRHNNGIPMFIATDQEGGWITHLKNGFTLFPSFYALGEIKDKRVMYIISKITAKELNEVGININFAPVAELSLNETNWVIGPRALGLSPEKTVEFLNEFIRGHLEENIMPVLKHFPGISRIKSDPHIHLITNNANYNVLKNYELKPYIDLMYNYPLAIMVGNVSVPGIVKFVEKITKQDLHNEYYLPATISDAIVHRFLLDYLKFKGIVISDEINVKSMKNFMT